MSRVIQMRTFNMNRHIFQNSAFLKALYRAHPFQRKTMIDFITANQVAALSQIAYKILRRRITISNVQRERLRPYKRYVRFIANPQINTDRKKRMLRAFHNMVPLLIEPFLHLLDEN